MLRPPSGSGAVRVLLLALFLFVVAVPPGGGTARARTACAEAGRPLRVMTLNLQFTRVWGRGRELDTLARYVAAREVDVLLLQEVSGGLLAGASSTADELRQILHGRFGLAFELVYAPASGVRGLFTVGNAVLSRCPVVRRAVARLPEVAELRVAGAKWRLERNVLGVEIATHDGSVAVYTTHLCADCEAEDRSIQLARALTFLNRREAGRDRPVLFGGDFNLDIFRSAGERRLYRRIRDAGFVDVAAVDRPAESLCAEPSRPDDSCTVGVADPIRPHSRRIDYLFARGAVAVVEQEVVFNPRIDARLPAVSNHAAVAAALRLGGMPRIARSATARPGL